MLTDQFPQSALLGEPPFISLENISSGKNLLSTNAGKNEIPLIF